MSESSSGEEFEDICPSDPPVPKWPLPPVCALIAAPKAASLCVFGDRVPSKPLRLSIEDSANVRLEGFLVKPIVRFCVRIERSTKSCLIVRVRVLPLLDAGS